MKLVIIAGCWLIAMASAWAQPVELTFTVRFADCSAELNPSGKKTLDDVATVLKLKPRNAARITGHTAGLEAADNADSTQKLSELRAFACAAYLRSKGVVADRVFTSAQAYRQPVAPNDSEQGRARNRRTVVEVVQSEE